MKRIGVEIALNALEKLTHAVETTEEIGYREVLRRYLEETREGTVTTPLGYQFPAHQFDGMPSPKQVDYLAQHEMMHKQLSGFFKYTQWFPGTVAPARSGVYELRGESYAYFALGIGWYQWDSTVTGAEDWFRRGARDLNQHPLQRPAYYYQWRGLTHEEHWRREQADAMEKMGGKSAIARLFGGAGNIDAPDNPPAWEHLKKYNPTIGPDYKLPEGFKIIVPHQCTPWFPRTILPVRSGVYEIWKKGWFKPMYCHFLAGWGWHSIMSTDKDRFANPEYTRGDLEKGCEWRGLTHEEHWRSKREAQPDVMTPRKAMRMAKEA